MTGHQTEFPPLPSRTGLPSELLFLREAYPREQWHRHEGLDGIASMWLQRHDFFRRLGGMLTDGVGDYREGVVTAPQFAEWFMPRLNRFLGELDGHHNV